MQNKHLKQLRFTPLATAVYLSRLPNRAPSHHLSSIRLQNVYEMRDVSFFCKRLGEDYQKAFSDEHGFLSYAKHYLSTNKLAAGDDAYLGWG